MHVQNEGQDLLSHKKASRAKNAYLKPSGFVLNKSFGYMLRNSLKRFMRSP